MVVDQVVLNELLTKFDDPVHKEAGGEGRRNTVKTTGRMRIIHALGGSRFWKLFRSYEIAKPTEWQMVVFGSCVRVFGNQRLCLEIGMLYESADVNIVIKIGIWTREGDHSADLPSTW